MDYGHFQQKLVDKQRELEEEIARKGAALPEPGEQDARDYTDVAQDDQAISDTLDQAGSMTRTLEEVRDALLRIDTGTYGRCQVCGEPIDEARLKAVPWTQYCRQHQQQRQAARGGPTL